MSLWKASILPVVGLGFADRRDSIHVTHVLGQHMFVFHRPKKLVNIPAGVLFILVILHGSILIHDLVLQSISISDGLILISNMRCRYLVIHNELNSGSALSNYMQHTLLDTIAVKDAAIKMATSCQGVHFHSTRTFADFVGHD